MVHPDGTLYAEVRPEDAAEIVEQQIENGNVVKRLALMQVSSTF